MEEMTLTSLLADMGSIFTAVTGYFADVIGMFVSQPILLLTFGISFVAIVVHMARGFLGR
ncbi:hypothetical protein [Sedimentibacter sp.]|uniref:hypothetical protein n=1 Tax=Sedimentibacter sp. TaxID=1960295 RepID=UPI0028AB50DF|nr:hypothetical protein [Sedimentibacter sp.]